MAEPVAPPVDPHALPGNAHTDAAMANVLRMFLLSGALGGLGRLAVGARDFFSRNTSEPRHAPPRHSMIPLPYPVPEKLGMENERESPAPPSFHLQADDPTDHRTAGQLNPAPLAGVLGGPGDPEAPNVPEAGVHATETKQAAALAEKAERALALLKRAADEVGPVDQAAHWLTENLGMIRHPSGNNWGTMHEMLFPQNVKGSYPVPSDMPWAWPAAALGVAGGGVLGWHGVDRLLHGAKDQEEESELAAAKRRFESALLARSPLKAAGYAGLDALAERAEADGYELKKEAFDIGHPLLGAYLLTAIGSGLLTGRLAHKYFSESSPDRAVEEALKRRRLMLHQAAPRPFVAEPVAVPVRAEEDEGPAA